MLTEQGANDVRNKVFTELTQHGGPFAAPCGPFGEETFDPASGLLRKKVTGGIGPQMCAVWTATAADVGFAVRWIGVAAQPHTPFLFHIPLAVPGTGSIMHTRLGDVVELKGPFRLTVS